MYYVIQDAGYSGQYLSKTGDNLLTHQWSKNVEDAIPFNTVSDAARACGKWNWSLVNIVKVERGKLILTVM